MHDLQTLDKLNAEATSRWQASAEFPHAVVHKMGLQVQDVIPVRDRVAGDELAAKLANPMIGENATVV
jgi:hypothetical protein